MSYYDASPINTFPPRISITPAYDHYSDVPRTPTMGAMVGGPVGAAVLPRHQRASSGAWSPRDDATLLAARAAGQSWSEIHSRHFPDKSGNACRKRHERLREVRGSKDSGLERTCKEYIGMREGMWKPLAKRCGENWKAVEQKCMSYGLENMRQAAEGHSFEVSQSTYEAGDLGLVDDYGQPEASGVARHDYAVSATTGLSNYTNQSPGANLYLMPESRPSRYGRHRHSEPYQLRSR